MLPSVLVVDDEPSIVSLLKTSLEQDGISTVAAYSAGEAGQFFALHHSSIQVLVTDIMMPETTGIELARKLLAENPELQVLFISGYCNAHDGAPQGFECLSKPFKASEVVGRVRRLLGQSKAAGKAGCEMLKSTGVPV